MTKPTCILVIGTPRSGTSCVAGVVHHLGIAMGERLMEADEWNPNGYFQDLDFYIAEAEELNAGFPKWTTSKRLANHQGAKRFCELAKARADKGGIWGLKSNRVIHFLDAFIKGAGDDIRVIRTSRPLTNSIDSWKARSGDNAKESARVITQMSDAIDNGLAQCGLQVSLTVDFQDLVNNPHIWVERIAGVCGVPSAIDAVNWIDRSLVRFE